MRPVFCCILTVLVIGASFADTQSLPISLGDLLERAAAAEKMHDLGGAVAAYTQLAAANPTNATVRVKLGELMIRQGKPTAAGQLFEALNLLMKDPGATEEEKRQVCALLAGEYPSAWQYDAHLQCPMCYLMPDERERLFKMVPLDWLYPAKMSQATHYLDTNEPDKAIALATEIIESGEWGNYRTFVDSPKLDPARKNAMIEGWTVRAEKTGGGYMWLAAVSAYWSRGNTEKLKAVFPKAFDVAKSNRLLAQGLYDICSQMRWQEGANQLKPYVAPASQAQREAEGDLDRLDRAIANNNLEQAKTLVLGILADSMWTNTQHLTDTPRVRAMMKNGWDAFVARLIPEDVPSQASLDMFRAILYEAAPDQRRFDGWLKTMRERLGVKRLEYVFSGWNWTHADLNDKDRVAWIMEQGAKLCPDDPDMLNNLAQSWIQLGYRDKAAAAAERAVEILAKSNRLGGTYLFTLWQAAGTNAFSWLLQQKDKLPVSAFVGISPYMRNSGKAEELKCLDLAFSESKARGWDKDLETWVKIEEMRRSKESEAEIQKLSSNVARTSELYRASTYGRYVALLKDAGRMTEADRVTAEAKRLDPSFGAPDRFRFGPPGPPVDCDVELAAVKKRLAYGDGSGYFRRGDIVIVAYCLVKSGQDSTVDAVAREVLPTNEEMRKGLKLATAMFRTRISGVVPFANWLVDAHMLDTDFASQSYSSTTVFGLMDGIEDTSLKAALRISYELLLPPVHSSSGQQRATSSYLYDQQRAMRSYAVSGWKDVTPSDQRALIQLLKQEKLIPPGMLGFYNNYDTYVPGREIIAELFRQRTDLAAAVLADLGSTVATSSVAAVDAELNALLDKLAAAADWTIAEPYSLITLADDMKQRGYKTQAVRMLEIVVGKADPKDPYRLAWKLAELSGKPAPENPYDKTAAGLLDRARILMRQKKTQEAKAACLKALELSMSQFDLGNCFVLLAEIDPKDAVAWIAAKTDYLSRLGFEKTGEVLLAAVAADKSVAPRAAGLIDRMMAVGRNYYPWGCAPVYFAAGRMQAGVNILVKTAGYVGDSKSAYGGTLMWSVVDPVVPDQARAALSKGLAEQLQKDKPGLSALAEGIENSPLRDFTSFHNDQVGWPRDRYSTGGLVTLAGVLKDYAAKPTTIASKSFFVSVLYFVKNTSPGPDMPSKVQNAWLDLVKEALADRPGRTRDESAAAASWIRQWMAQSAGGTFASSPAGLRLTQIADSLERSK